MHCLLYVLSPMFCLLCTVSYALSSALSPMHSFLHCLYVLFLYIASCLLYRTGQHLTAQQMSQSVQVDQHTLEWMRKMEMGMGMDCVLNLDGYLLVMDMMVHVEGNAIRAMWLGCAWM